ncbi:30S ribosomal protein S6--L-glutamate ligase [Shewanella avicenniae]|uniref:Probable alpha-L-glutamate ligase n=1 Tax=Shewanella avicenniae TaxID=2814294 RepID=A0ABX7QT19_9GAMM|nr:30S ribosomal protein S6--L-glutamate ligase [Shewanella avicenniae]
MKQSIEPKIVIGSDEWCAFPSLNIPAIKARVDSGAKTSSLHAINIQPFSRNGEAWVSFEVHPIQDNRKVTVHCEAKVIDQRIIKSSSGDREKRLVIRVPLAMGEQLWDVEVTLTNRDSMGYRMLLGREAMHGRTLVDPAGHCLLGERLSDQLATLYRAPEIRTTGLKIGLLASNPNLYSNRRIIEAAESRGHEIQFFNIKNCYMKLDATRPEIHYRGGLVLNELDAVIPRIRPSMTFYACTLLRQFESLGIYCLNSSTAIAQSRDKLRALQLLLDNGLDIPTTGFANSPLDTGDLINMVGGAPLIIKLLEGTQGKGVVLAETRKAAESVINAFKSLNANILVQEFIKESSGKDLRCFVVDGKVVASIQRVAAPGEFRANIHQGGRAELIKITPEERRIAIKAAKAMDLKVAGVDLIRSNKGPLLLEVNSSPGLEGIETATNEDIASKMIIAIEKQLAGKKKAETSS